MRTRLPRGAGKLSVNASSRPDERTIGVLVVLKPRKALLDAGRFCSMK
jgi:hypothetical protein